MVKQGEIDLNAVLKEALRITFCVQGEVSWQNRNDYRHNRLHGELIFVGRRSPEGGVRTWVTHDALRKLLDDDLLVEFVPEDGSLDRFRVELRLTPEAVNARTVERARWAVQQAERSARERLEQALLGILGEEVWWGANGREPAHGIMDLLDDYVAERVAAATARPAEPDQRVSEEFLSKFVAMVGEVARRSIKEDMEALRIQLLSSARD